MQITQTCEKYDIEFCYKELKFLLRTLEILKMPLRIFLGIVRIGLYEKDYHNPGISKIHHFYTNNVWLESCKQSEQNSDIIITYQIPKAGFMGDDLYSVYRLMVDDPTLFKLRDLNEKQLNALLSIIESRGKEAKKDSGHRVL